MSGPSAAARVAVPVALVLAVLLAYAGALHGPFQFDDWWSIVGDARVHSVQAWWQAQPVIRPLLKLANALNWLAAPTPAGFRAMNIAVHAGAVVLAWALWRAWVPRLAPRCPRPEFAAAVAAALFALHPAATEAVTYVSGRSVSLSTLAMFAALLAWTRAVRDPARARVAAAVGAVSFAAAVAVRETALVAPLAWLLLARGGGLGWREVFAPLRPLARPPPRGRRRATTASSAGACRRATPARSCSGRSTRTATCCSVRWRAACWTSIPTCACRRRSRRREQQCGQDEDAGMRGGLHDRLRTFLAVASGASEAHRR